MFNFASCMLSRDARVERRARAQALIERQNEVSAFLNTPVPVHGAGDDTLSLIRDELHEIRQALPVAASVYGDAGYPGAATRCKIVSEKIGKYLAATADRANERNPND